MVSLRVLAWLCVPPIVLSATALGADLVVEAVALVEAHAPAWKQVPESARIDPKGLSYKRKFFLEGRPAMPVKAPEVRKAMADALKPLSKAERTNTRKVLDAVGEWAAANLAETAGPLACPSMWRPAPQVLKEKSGNRFELVRAVTAMLRSAGIPARPSFNGLPMVCVFAVPPGGNGFWTVWDPFHPSASLTRLPVLWVPLRAEEVPLVVVKPVPAWCEPNMVGRRYVRRSDAEASFASVKSTGAFPASDVEPLPADAVDWWEVWIVGARFYGLEGKTAISFPLPFVVDPLPRCGTRDWGVWISEPARLKGKPSVHTRTDQVLGGILMDVRLELRPAPVSATTGA